MTQRICKKCSLWRKPKGQGPGLCSVVILINGERIRIPTDGEDRCFFDQTWVNPETGKEENFHDVQQVKFWVENEQGEKVKGDGIVKMQYPDGFFGKTIEEILG